MANTASSLPDAFIQSYIDLESYPVNLVYKPTFVGALKAYKERLDETATDLFATSEAEAHVRFRDLLSSGSFENPNIYNDAALRNSLGNESVLQAAPASSARAINADPRCRFIYFSAEDSRSPLKITREMMCRLMTYHQVMPGYLDFLSVFGLQSEPRDLRYSGFREQTLLSKPSPSPVMNNLGRSGRQYQLCYNLKSAECISPRRTLLEKTRWSIRQAAFHHQFDVETGTTLWIATKGNPLLKDRIRDMTGVRGRPEDRSFGTLAECFQSSLAVHLLFGHWSTEGWRTYIQWLEHAVEEETRVALLGSRIPGKGRRLFEPEDLQNVQNSEDKTNEAAMILEANVDVLTSVRDYYLQLIERSDFPLQTTSREAVDLFANQMTHMIHDLRMHISRAKLLIRITGDRKSLILQHLQSQATEKMELMTENMHNLGVMSQEDAIIMRIITVVTLIYLPPTFVSTFFSTDVVKYQGEGNGSFSLIAMVRWIQVTLPLTLLTLVIGFIAFKIAEGKRKGRLHPIQTMFTKGRFS